LLRRRTKVEKSFLFAVASQIGTEDVAMIAYTPSD
jgi:hypothetical protein